MIQISRKRSTLIMHKGYMTTTMSDIDEIIFVQFLRSEFLCFCKKFIDRKSYKCNEKLCTTLYTIYNNYFTDTKSTSEYSWKLSIKQSTRLVNYLFTRISYYNFYAEKHTQNDFKLLDQLQSIIDSGQYTQLLHNMPQLCHCHCIVDSADELSQYHPPLTLRYYHPVPEPAFKYTPLRCVFCNTQIIITPSHKITFLHFIDKQHVTIKDRTFGTYKNFRLYVMMVDKSLTRSYHIDKTQVIKMYKHKQRFEEILSQDENSDLELETYERISITKYGNVLF